LTLRRVFPIKARLSIEEDYKFRMALLDAIDESLNKILGETSTQFIYSFLKRHHLKREGVPDNLECFQFVLEKIFGLGAYVIEQAIMENLYFRLSLEAKKKCVQYENPEQFNFVTYVNSLKKSTSGPRKRHVSKTQYDYNKFRWFKTPLGCRLESRLLLKSIETRAY